MRVLWIASDNRKKLAELERLLAPLGYELRRLGDAPAPVDIVEDRLDFAGNAEVKATALARAVSAPAVGDDSGLCVDALGGRPGVRSARYGGAGLDDRGRVALLLDELGGVADRRARFVCHLCLAAPGGEVAARIEESCEGTILERPQGSGGFGYDPVFACDEHPDRSFAELSPEQKDAVSHRGRALRRLAAYLERHPPGR